MCAVSHRVRGEVVSPAQPVREGRAMSVAEELDVPRHRENPPDASREPGTKRKQRRSEPLHWQCVPLCRNVGHTPCAVATTSYRKQNEGAVAVLRVVSPARVRSLGSLGKVETAPLEVVRSNGNRGMGCLACATSRTTRGRSKKRPHQVEMSK